jgi:hypothetical protein
MKYIKTLNELHSDTYLSAAQKAKKYNNEVLHNKFISHTREMSGSDLLTDKEKQKYEEILNKERGVLTLEEERDLNVFMLKRINKPHSFLKFIENNINVKSPDNIAFFSENDNFKVEYNHFLKEILLLNVSYKYHNYTNSLKSTIKIPKMSKKDAKMWFKTISDEGRITNFDSWRYLWDGIS